MTFINHHFICQLARTGFGFILFFCYVVSATGQPTVGLIKYTEEITESYTLFTPLNSASTFLIDNCGKKINEWDGLVPNHSNIAMLGTDGNLVRASFNFLEKLSWDNEVVWSFNINNLGLNLLRHHDIFIMPNGNILFIASQIKSMEEMVEKGRNPLDIGPNGFKVDGIYELMPIGVNNAELVWSWSFLDHLVQDFDETKENFDEVINQPTRLNVNFKGEEASSFDWLHCNGIDYNQDLDQLIISSRNNSELYIIDHSTTAAEAATSSGGLRGLGGDFLWRWGNPIVYDMGTVDDQQLYEQHDPKWIKNGYPNAGKITVFNNLFNYDFTGDEPYSSVHILDPGSSIGVYPLNSTATYQPVNFNFTYTGEVAGNNLLSKYMSNVQMMPNGNLFILQGSSGEMLEVNQNEEVVWVYQNPAREFIYDQGVSDLDFNSGVEIFIATKYTADYQGFSNYDMTPTSILENENEVSEICNSSVDLEETLIPKTAIFPNPVTDILTLESTLLNYDLSIFDVLGKELLSRSASLDVTIDLSNFMPGVYFLTINSSETIVETLKIVVE